MLNANKLLNQMLGAGPAAQGQAGAESESQSGGLFGSLVEGVKSFAGQNKVAAGAALGGLGGLLLGSKGGRSILGGGAAMGGLALIGGLAWKAFQNFQGFGKSTNGRIEAAPAESPYGETGDARQDNIAALLILRAMISAAACDGTIDAEERARIIGGLRKLGLEKQATNFLNQEIARPASAAELARAAKTPEMASQIYAAARVAIDPNSAQEKVFLTELMHALKLDPGLAAQIDATASNASFH